MSLLEMSSLGSSRTRQACTGQERKRRWLPVQGRSLGYRPSTADLPRTFAGIPWQSVRRTRAMSLELLSELWFAHPSPFVVAVRPGSDRTEI